MHTIIIIYNNNISVYSDIKINIIIQTNIYNIDKIEDNNLQAVFATVNCFESTLLFSSIKSTKESVSLTFSNKLFHKCYII